MSRGDRWLAFSRTVRGQLALMALSYGLVAAGAVVVLCLRTQWFETTVCEKFPTAEKNAGVPKLERLAREIASGETDPARLDELTASELVTVYGVLLDGEDVDPQNRLSGALWQQHPEQMIDRVRRTFVVGNRRQRLRALEILGRMSPLINVGDARQLCQYALLRAERRGEVEVESAAAQLLEQLNRHSINKGDIDERRQ